MKPGRHAAADGSFGRSAGAAGGRGFALIAVALLLGTLVLNATDDEPPGARLTTGSSPTVDDGDDGDDGADTTTTLPTITSTTLPPLRPPAEVKVLVVNGTRTKGAAKKVTDVLAPAGYNTLAPTDAPATDASKVYFEVGYEKEAAAVASLLQLPASAVVPIPVPVPVSGGNLRGANVLVQVGPELAVRYAGATSTTAAGSTSTTARTTSTTARATSTTARATSTTTTTR